MKGIVFSSQLVEMFFHLIENFMFSNMYMFTYLFKYVCVYIICFLTGKLPNFPLPARHKKWRPFFFFSINSSPVPCNFCLLCLKRFNFFLCDGEHYLAFRYIWFIYIWFIYIWFIYIWFIYIWFIYVFLLISG